MYSGGGERVLVRWNLEATNVRNFLPRLPAPILHLAVSPNNQAVAIATQDNGESQLVLVWWKSLQSLRSRCCCFHPHLECTVCFKISLVFLSLPLKPTQWQNLFLISQQTILYQPGIQSSIIQKVNNYNQLFGDIFNSNKVNKTTV